PLSIWSGLVGGGMEVLWCVILVLVCETADEGRRARGLRGRQSSRGTPRLLLAQAEPLDQSRVTLGALVLQVGEQPAALRDELHETAPGVMVLGVGLEVLGQVGDPVGQKGDLDFGGSGVGRVGPKLPDDAGLLGLVLGDAHCFSLLLTLHTFSINHQPTMTSAFLATAGRQSKVNCQQSTVNSPQ